MRLQECLDRPLSPALQKHRRAFTPVDKGGLRTPPYTAIHGARKCEERAVLESLFAPRSHR